MTEKKTVRIVVKKSAAESDYDPMSLLSNIGTAVAAVPKSKRSPPRSPREREEPELQPTSFAPMPGNAASARSHGDPFPYSEDPSTHSLQAFHKDEALREEVDRATEELADIFGVSPRTGRRAPINQPLISRANQYKTDLPPLVRENIKRVQEFFLVEVLPFMMAVSNGLDDATDIAKLALEEEPQALAFKKFVVQVTNEAIKAKTVNFIQSLAELNPQEERMFKLAYLSISGVLQNGDTTQALLREVLAVSDMQRSTKNNTEVLVRKVSKIERDRESPGPGARTGRAKGRAKRT